MEGSAEPDANFFLKFNPLYSIHYPCTMSPLLGDAEQGIGSLNLSKTVVGC